MRQDSYCFSLEAVEISQDFLTTVTWTKLVHKHSCPEEKVRFSVKTVSVNLDFWFIKDFLLKAATVRSSKIWLFWKFCQSFKKISVVDSFSSKVEHVTLLRWTNHEYFFSNFCSTLVINCFCYYLHYDYTAIL